MSDTGSSYVRNITVQIVSSYVGSQPTETGQVPQIIQEVARTIAHLNAPEPPVDEKPRVPVKGSVKPESITCLECGEQMTTLRKHLSMMHATTPEEYRKKWGLTPEYPMSAPAYSKLRSQLAIDRRLGHKDSVGFRKRAGGVV